MGGVVKRYLVPVLGFCLVVAGVFCSSSGRAQQRPQQWSAPILSWLSIIEGYLGKPLHSTAIEANNRNRFVLHLLTLSEARFAFGASKAEPGEAFDAFRKRSNISFLLSTCEGRSGVDSPIFRVVVYQKINEELQPKVPTILKDLLERANNPSALSIPASVRAVGVTNSSGLTFEYTAGTRVILAGLFNDNSDDGQGYIAWSIADTSVCR